MGALFSTPYHWPNASRAAVTLTYDGTRRGHAELVLPLLDSIGLHGTFFVEPTTFLEDPSTWCAAAERGHLLGNGCLLGAADPDGSLPRWTKAAIASEIDATDQLLKEFRVGGERSPFAFPWGQPLCAGHEDYRELLEASFRLGRSGVEGYNAPTSCECSYLRCLMLDGYTLDEIQRVIQGGIDRNAWIILAFEGIGEGERSVDLATHHQLVKWLAEDPTLTLGTLSSIAELIQQANPARLGLG